MKRDARKKLPKQRSREPIYLIPFKNAGGSLAWRVTGMHKGKQVRENFKSETEALARKDELLGERVKRESSVVRRPTRLTEVQIKEAEVAFAEMADRPLLAAVRFYLDHHHDPVNRITVKKGFDKFIAEKRKNHLRPDSIRNLQVRVGFLASSHSDRLLSDIVPDHLKQLIFTEGRSAVTSNNVRRALSSFFTWATEQGFCASNPMTTIKPLTVEREEPATLTVVQARKLMAQAATFKDGVVLPYMALGLFAGIRPTELARLSWEQIDLEAGTITIEAMLRQRRIVEMVCLTEMGEKGKERKSPANLIAWLLPHAARKTPILGVNWRKDFDAVKAAAGWGTETRKQPHLKPWTQDILRHTAISNHLAHFQHEGKAAAWAGISPDIIHRHYNGLVKAAAAVEFWSIRRCSPGPDDHIGIEEK